MPSADPIPIHRKGSETLPATIQRLRIARETNPSRATVSRILRREHEPAVRSAHRRPSCATGTNVRATDPSDINGLARVVKPGHRIHCDRTREPLPHASLNLNTPASRLGLNRNDLLSLHS